MRTATIVALFATAGVMPVAAAPGVMPVAAAPGAELAGALLGMPGEKDFAQSAGRLRVENFVSGTKYAFTLEELQKGTGDHLAITNPRTKPDEKPKGSNTDTQSLKAQPDSKKALTKQIKQKPGPETIDNVLGGGVKSGYKFELAPAGMRIDTRWKAEAKPITTLPNSGRSLTSTGPRQK